MNSIDERLVAMRFDNSQFEKGVKHSMKTLQELREATNLDDVAGSIGEVSKSINQGLKFDTPAKSAGIFSKALTSMGKVAKKTFNAATFPLQALGRSLQSLGKYTRAVLGIDLASQLVHTGEQVIRAFTIDPLKSGWNEYELKMDSIKTIMTGTVKTYTDAMTKKDPQFLYDEEKHLEYVKQGLEELNKYADDTIYSFENMTSSIGKFTNAGVDFETAVDAIKGIANAAAHAGQGAAQANMAMYNLSQSLGMGYLTLMDWRSIENANMATLTFKQTLIDLGVALGQLKKDEKSGKIFTINEQGVMDESLEVAAENLRETLSKKWVTNEVLLSALRVYSGEMTRDELQQYSKLSEDQVNYLMSIGEEAALAATQVRTFTKMWDALKEAAQSGWAISWELIFGDMNEATSFWTSLNDRFSKLLGDQADARNDLLRAWRGQRQQYNYETGEIEWIDDSRLTDGRKILIDSLNEMLDTLQRVGGAIGEAWTSVFGEFDSNTLMGITKRFSAFTKKFSEWLGRGDDQNSRISKMTKGLKGFFSLLKGAGSVLKGALSTLVNVFHVDKLVDTGIDIFAKVGEWLSGLGDSISHVWETIGQSQIVQKVSKGFEDLWDTASKFFTEPNKDTGNTDFVDWLNRIYEGLTKGWTEFTGSDFYTGAKNVWNKVINFFKPISTYDEFGNDAWEQSPFMQMLTGITDGASKKWDEFTKSDFYKNVSSFFTSLYDSVSKFFTEKNEATGKTGFMDSITAGIQWMSGTFQSLEEKWQEFKGGSFYKGASNVWNKVINFFKPISTYDEFGNDAWEQSPFMQMLTGITDGASKKWDEFTKSDFYKNVSSFFTSLYDSVSKFFTEKNEATGKTGFMDSITAGIQWMSGTFQSLEEKWTEFKNGDFFTNISSIWDNIVSFFQPKTIIGKQGNTWKEDSQFISWIKDSFNSIKEFAKSLSGDTDFASGMESFGGIMDTLLGFVIPKASAEEASESVGLIGTTAEKIQSEWESNKQTFDTISTELGAKTDEIIKTPDKFDTEPKTGSALNWFVSLGNGLNKAWTSVSESIASIAADIKKVTDSVSQAITGAIEWVQTVNWDEVLSKLEGHAWSLSGIFTLFSGGRLLGSIGGFNKSKGKLMDAFGNLTSIFGENSEKLAETASSTMSELGKNLGEGAKSFLVNFDSTKKLGAMGDVALKFSGAVLVLVGSLYAITQIIESVPANTLNYATGLLGGIAALLGTIMVLSLAGGVSSAKLGTNVMALSVGILLIIAACKRIADLTNEGYDFADAGLILAGLTTLIGAFEALSTADFGEGATSFGKNKKTGLIGFAIAIQSMILAIKQIAELEKNNVDITHATVVLTALTGLITGFELLSNISGKGEVRSFSLGGGGGFTGLVGFALAITAMIGAVQKIAKLDQASIDNGMAVLTKITAMISAFEFFKGLGNFMGTFNGFKNGSGLLGFVSAITAMLAEVVLIGGLDPEKAQHGAEIMQKITDMINAFEFSKGASNFLSSFIKTGSQVLGLVELTAFVGGLAGLLYAVNDLASNEKLDVETAQNIADMLGQLAIIISGSGVALVAITEGLALIGPAGAGKAVGALGIIFGGTGLLGILVSGIAWLADSWIGTENLEQVPKKIENFGAIFIAIAKVIGEIIGALAGGISGGIQAGAEKGKYEGMAEGLKILTSATNELNDDDIKRLETVMDALNIISNKLPDNPGLLEKWFGGKMTLGMFGDNMKQLGSGLSGFATNVSKITDFDSVMRAINAVSSLVRAAATIAVLDDLGGGNWDAANYVYQMVQLIGSLGRQIGRYTDEDFSKEFDPLISFGEMFDADIQAAADKISLEPLIQSVLTQLGSGKERISQSFGDMFPTSVEPVYDASNLDDMPLLSYQNGTITLDGIVQIDPVSLNGVVNAVNTQGRNIVGAVNNMRGEIRGVASAIRSIKIVLNTGVIAGAVDTELGNQATLNGRTGTSSGSHGPVVNTRNPSYTNTWG